MSDKLLFGDLDISTLMLGDATVDKVYLGDNVVYSSFPSGYTRLKCIISTGTQYIYTKITQPTASSPVSFTFTAQGTASPTTSNIVIGNNANAGTWIGSAGVYNFWGLGSSAYLPNVQFTDKITDAVATFYTDRCELTYGGTTVVRAGTTSNTRFYLLGTLSGFNAKAKWYGGKVERDGSVIYNFIPAMRNSDSAIGLLDLVNNEFYENGGTGTFGYES